MTKDEAIESISHLYPADSEYHDCQEIGKRFMTEAMEEMNFNWRELPEDVLIRYAEKCEWLENDNTRTSLKRNEWD